jgi:hypothetical protein
MKIDLTTEPMKLGHQMQSEMELFCLEFLLLVIPMVYKALWGLEHLPAEETME